MFIIHDIADRIMLNAIAETNPSTTNSSTIQAHNKIIRAFITNKKSPRVIRVNGSARSFIIGFMNVFKNARATATMISVVTPEIDAKDGSVTPGVSHAEIAIARQDNISFIIMLIVYSFKVF